MYVLALDLRDCKFLLSIEAFSGQKRDEKGKNYIDFKNKVSFCEDVAVSSALLCVTIMDC